LICTFLDAGVLIAGIRGDPATVERVLEILNDPERAFAASDFVRLEVLPKALYFRQQAEAAFYEAYFATVVEMVEVSPALVAQAYDEAQRAGLAGMDALHVAAAKDAGVTEFITVEKPTKPLFRVTGLTVQTLEAV
jgi:predicted nucleic acid-binding protein